jgi:anti-sigma factor RsiW
MSRSDEQHRCTGGGPGDGHEHGVSCREISEFLLAYLEAELEPEVRAEFDRHLNHCPPCIHYLDGYRETIELVRACVRGADLAPGAGSGLGPQFGDACVEAERAKHKPPEGLIQAILAAKRSLES